MKQSFKKHNELILSFSPYDIFKETDCRPFIWSHFIRHNLLLHERFNESLELGEDQEFIIRYMCNSKRVFFTSRILYTHYNNHNSSYNRISMDPNKMCKNHITMVKSILSTVAIDSEEYRTWVFNTLYDPFVHSDRNPEDAKAIRQIFQSMDISTFPIDHL